MKIRTKTILAPALALALPLFHAHAGNVDAQLKQGDEFESKIETQKALDAYLAAEKTDPNNPEVLYRIAREYDELMDDTSPSAGKRALAEKGLAYAHRAVEAGPKNAMAHLALAICYGRIAPLLDNKTKVDYSKHVKEEAEACLAINPDQYLAYHILGVWNYEMADLNPVLRGIAKLVYGDLPAASFEKAETDFKKAIALKPDFLANHVELGRTYAAMGRKDEAMAELKRGLALPDQVKDDPEAKERAKQALAKL
jgi:tetratricopeptide (TPR) repeat protein